MTTHMDAMIGQNVAGKRVLDIENFLGGRKEGVKIHVLSLREHTYINY